MANERTYAILPCSDLDESIAFYESLGFTRTYRQIRPNPSAVVALEDIHIHLCGIEGFDPEASYASVIIAVPDPDSLYRAFAAGLRETHGKLPVKGIPRILRPRKRYGTVRGFTVIDPGGNWLRVYRLGDTEEEASAEKAEGLAQIILVGIDSGGTGGVPSGGSSSGRAESGGSGSGGTVEPEPPVQPEPPVVVPPVTPEPQPQNPSVFIDVDCSDFDTSEEAQAFFDGYTSVLRYDAHKLDRDGDGIVCSSLP